ncbi:hypothetical protein EVC24_152 [Rhizobium phage RHph_I4]|nr:hypothetical protein EVC24_152 [Rhizobium phage RHph_I4]
MPQVYIPEISDLWKLEQPWSFTLYDEYRNADLWKALDADNHPSLAGLRQQIAEIDAAMEVIKGRMRMQDVPKMRWVSGSTFMSAGRHEEVIVREKTFDTPADRIQYDTLHRQRYALLNNRSVPVILPSETVLRVDRIYIRKGKSEYSSLTFYVVGSPHEALKPVKTNKGFKQGRKRFWAKLEDVNNLAVKHVATMDEALTIVGLAPVGKRMVKIDE